MPERDDFIRTVLEHPADDGPRLVYADWLEERGDPRGEFIRVQCQLAKWEMVPGERFDGMTIEGKRLDFVPTAALVRRERELFAADSGVTATFNGDSQPTRLSNERHWRRQFFLTMFSGGEAARPSELEGPATISQSAIFHRGFVEEIACDWPTWGGGPCSRRYAGAPLHRGCPVCSGTRRVLGHADAILASTPLRRCKLTTRPPSNDELIASGSPYRVVAGPKGSEIKRVDGSGRLLDAWPGVKIELPPALPQLSLALTISDAALRRGLTRAGAAVRRMARRRMPSG